MRACTAGWVVLGLALSVAWGSPCLADREDRGTPAELMAALKVGQWVKMEGPAGNSASVTCTEAKIMAGDYLDDDWEIRGNVRRVDPTKGLVMVFTLAARLGDNAVFKGDSDDFEGLADVRTGMYVKLEGTYLRDGWFIAKKVSERTEELVKKPDHRGRVWVKGRIERVESGGRSVTVMGIPFVITSATRVKSGIR